jgi:hypothetical protein
MLENSKLRKGSTTQTWLDLFIIIMFKSLCDAQAVDCTDKTITYQRPFYAAVIEFIQETTHRWVTPNDLIAFINQDSIVD